MVTAGVNSSKKLGWERNGGNRVVARRELGVEGAVLWFVFI